MKKKPRRNKGRNYFGHETSCPGRNIATLNISEHTFKHD